MNHTWSPFRSIMFASHNHECLYRHLICFFIWWIDEEWFMKWGEAESLTHLYWHELMGWLCKLVLERFFESHTAQMAQLTAWPKIGFWCNKFLDKQTMSVAMASGVTHTKLRKVLISSPNYIYSIEWNLLLKWKQSLSMTSNTVHVALISVNLGRLHEERSHFKHGLHSPRCRHTTHKDTYLLQWRAKMSMAWKVFISW